MPYPIPTLTGLIADAQQDIASADIKDEAGNTIDGFLSTGIVPIVAGVTLPGFAYGHYGYQAEIARQAVPWTSTGEFWAGWAALKGVSRIAATFATGTVTFPGTGTTPLPVGSPIARSDNVKYITTADAAVSAGFVTAPIIAITAGAAANFVADTTFFMTVPISGIVPTSSASAQVIAGVDQETFDAFKSRGLAIYAAPPQGGDAQDYVEWATSVAGVTRAWVVPLILGAGTVGVYFMMDLAEAAHGGFPQGTGGVATNEPRDIKATGDPLTVANSLFPKQPVDALVYVLVPIALPIAFTIDNLRENNTPEMRAAITAALEDMFLRESSVAGTMDPETRSPLNEIQPNAWYAAISAIEGLKVFSVSVPSAPIARGATGQLAVLGTVTFNT